MPWAAGTYSLPRDWVNDKNSSVAPSAANFKQQDDDIATGLNNCLTRDGQGKPSANLDINTYRLTNIGAATARTDASQAAQVQDSSLVKLGAVAGTDTITGTLTPALLVYATNMVVNFIPAGTNTGAATININGLGAKTIQKWSGTALAAGDIVISVPAILQYTGSVFILMNPQLSSGLLAANVPLLSASNVFTGATQTINASNATLKITDGTREVRVQSEATKGSIGTFSNHAFAIFTNNATVLSLDAAGTLAGSTIANVAFSDFARLSQANTFTASSLTLSNASPALTINETDGNNTAQLSFQNAGVARGTMGSCHAASALVAGTADGDLAISAVNGGLFFSGNNGTTAHLKLSSAGVVTTPGASSGEVGTAGVVQNSQSVDYTCVLTDKNKEIYQTGASKTVTIPSNASVAFPIGTVLTGTFTNATGGTVAITTDTMTLAGSTSTGSRTVVQNGWWTARKETATTWLITGAGVS